MSELNFPAGHSVQFGGRGTVPLLKCPIGHSAHPSLPSATYVPGSQPVVGCAVGRKLTLGSGVGRMVGTGVGAGVGLPEGSGVDGTGVGRGLGTLDTVGRGDGKGIGRIVGAGDGRAVGSGDGIGVGPEVGSGLGGELMLGAGVGDPYSSPFRVQKRSSAGASPTNLFPDRSSNLKDASSFVSLIRRW